ncbi:MAG: Glucosamine/fructose-6-phosphate aminotransferase, isomerizing [Berkelbacteria bacterium GW2011_GWA1_36_9]|uniref:Glutamine--fructose-6-phosphate aminotransferase [isomerizing] n=1 Tax=Berkelbacteria bacterium GW2011_GWA1_36_9 TaxID=1618331 RepID=A0A0G0FM38_9BACT|nr:MAG: Glucosamine/fructose-6-phosphate aminotransferase, isomerizing [Berkelbacteria bacterium GW2011_GWA1_36_9]
MCGIVGYIGKGNAKDFVVGALKKLEYRGYDSWGISLIENNNLKVIKETGKISKVVSKNITSNSHLAIGHTRWATHGGVTKENAHPHTDCAQNLAVVHNGIINNFEILKNNLIKKGHKFTSETDTEVIPHLVEENLKKNQSIVEAFRISLNALQGDYAICLISQNENKIYIAVNGCPLAIGIGKDVKYISSDLLAFADFTSDVILMRDGTLAEVGTEIKIYDIKTGTLKKVNSQKISTEFFQAKLGTFKHFLFKEINEQPKILEKIVAMDKKEIETNAALIRNSFGTFFVACGTAYHAALSAEYFFARFAKIHVNTAIASEFPAFGNFITDKTLLFAISQSGETADVIDAVKTARAKKAKIFSLLNNPNSTLGRLSDVVMLTPAGKEIAVLSTKAFTSQLAILYLLSCATASDLVKAERNLKITAYEVLEILKNSNIDHIKKLAKILKNSKNIFTIGRGLNFPTALEAALKIKEVSYIHAEGFAGGELKHGTIALIEKDVPCIVFVSNDETKDVILSNAQEIKARGGYIIGVAPEANKVFDYFLKVADLPDLSPILNIVPIQVLAYFLALEKGLDPDKPRNLAKSVTVK